MSKEPEVEVRRVKGAWEVVVTLEGRDAVQMTYKDDGTFKFFHATYAELCKVAWGVIDAMVHPPHSKN